MRPCILWFDECYDEEFYRSETVWKYFKEESNPVDALIVIGTALETSMARSLVLNSIK
jgi:NAD-dependent SIR2 family protein deacetylase